MSETSVKSGLATSTDSRSATSSLESECGATRSDALAGPTTGLSGQDPAPVNPSAPPEKEVGSRTTVTSGPIGSGSSASVILTRSLASRLRRRTALLGSTLFRLTWKERVTPAGRVIPALRASVLRTSGRGSTSWPTPSANNYEQDDQDALRKRREECRTRKGNGNGFGMTLGNIAHWITPQTHDDKEQGNVDADHHYSPHDLSNQAQLSPWSTPRSNKWGFPDAHGSHEQPASWPSPMARTPAQKGYNEAGNTESSRKTAALCGASLKGSGVIAIGSPASTEKPGQLNPAHSRWLMGLPTVWDSCGAMVIRLSRRKRKAL
jgi:hypothetical protein